VFNVNFSKVSSMKQEIFYSKGAVHI